MSTPAHDPSSFAILVVDDEPNNVDLLCRRLERKGYFTMSANSGAVALEKIGTTGFDLVLLDIMMPGMSGFEVLTRIRERYGPGELPVIMASARTDTEAITQCLESGANDYVTKPLDFPVVLARVRTQLTMRSAVEALRVSEGRFRMLADASPDIISEHAPDGAFRFASAASEAILGRPHADLVGKSLFDLLHPEDRAVMPALSDLPDLSRLMLRLQHADGRWVWCEVRARLTRGSRTKKVTDVACTIRDVSGSISDRGAAPLITPLGGAGMAPDMPVSEAPPPVRRSRTVQG